MKILLINPYLSQEISYGKNFKRLGAVMPPLGLCYIAGVLEKEGYLVNIIDANLKCMSNKDILDIIGKNIPDIIGFYATTLSIDIVVETVKDIKEKYPEIYITIGGPHISGYGKDTLKCKYFDFGIIGEGEYSFLDLVKCLESGSNNFDNIKGLVYKKNGEIIRNEPVQPIKNLDELPFPARHLLTDIKNYHEKIMLYKKQPVAHIFTSRGCPYKCIFCQTPLGKTVRFHSAEYVADEITKLVNDFGVKEIKINDDTFNLNEGRIIRIFDILKKRGIVIPWTCNLRVNTIKDKNFLKDIKERGCWMIRPGLESGNQKVLDVLKKGITLEQGKQVCIWAKDVGLKIQAFFVIGNPLDTEETICETINYAKSLPIDYPAFSLMTPFPGTEMWEKANEYGTFSYNKFSDLAYSHKVTFIPYGLNKNKLLYLYRKAYKDSYLNIRMILRHLKNIDSFVEFKRMCSAAFSFFQLVE
ncbi:MAG: radical SAM protein [Elusimicrobia bacterium]|nr:radical SAM protein [Elusimicrobiota bacterium]